MFALDAERLGSYFAQYNHFSLRNTLINPYLSEFKLSFTQTQKLAWSAQGRKLQQNTLNILQNIIKTFEIRRRKPSGIKWGSYLAQ